MGKSNQAPDDMGHHPKANNDNSSDTESKKYEAISYTTVHDALNDAIKGP